MRWMDGMLGKLRNMPGWLILGAIIVGVMMLLQHFPWLLLLPVLLLLVVIWRDSARAPSLRKHGYQINLRSDRWVYEERADGNLRKVDLVKYESGPERTLFIPPLDEWTARVPPWAAERREEMLRKLMAWQSPAYIRYPADWDFTPEERAADDAAKLQEQQDLETMKRDLRIGEEDSPWIMEETAEGNVLFRRKE